MIEDLSYSGLSDLIQSDVVKGKEVLVELSHRFIHTQRQVIEDEKRLKELIQDCDSLYNGVKRVMKHLTKTYPIAIQVEGGIIVVSEKTITFETNVL